MRPVDAGPSGQGLLSAGSCRAAAILQGALHQSLVFTQLCLHFLQKDCSPQTCQDVWG